MNRRFLELIAYLDRHKINVYRFCSYVVLALVALIFIFNSIPILNPLRIYFEKYSLMYLGIFATLALVLVFVNDENSTRYFLETTISIIIYSLSHYFSYNLITPDQTEWMALHTVFAKKVSLLIGFVSCTVVGYYFICLIKTTNRIDEDSWPVYKYFYKYCPSITAIVVSILYFNFLFINHSVNGIIYVTESLNVYELDILGVTIYQLLVIPAIIVMILALIKSYDKMDREKFILFPAAFLTLVSAWNDYKGITDNSFSIALGLDLLMLYLFVNLNQNQYERDKMAYDNLVMQMKPHFLFNFIAVLVSLNNEDTPREVINDRLYDFANYIRYFVDNTNKNETEISIERELEHVDYYFNLQKLRYPNIRLIKDIKKTNFNVPILTLQPLIENCINHSGITSLNNGYPFIFLKIYDTEKCHIIDVTDNGTGYRESQQNEKTHKSTGINNIRRRLQFSNPNNKLEIISPLNNNGGTSIRIYLYK